MSARPVSAESSARKLLRFAFWVPLAVCTYLALTPSPPEAAFRVSDVLLHGFAFAYLTFALGLAHRPRRWWHIAGWMMTYGLLIELVQSFEPERTAELKDVVVDGVGIALGLAGLWIAGDWVRSAALELTRSVVGSD